MIEVTLPNNAKLYCEPTGRIVRVRVRDAKPGTRGTIIECEEQEPVRLGDDPPRYVVCPVCPGTDLAGWIFPKVKKVKT